MNGIVYITRQESGQVTKWVVNIESIIEDSTSIARDLLSALHECSPVEPEFLQRRKRVERIAKEHGLAMHWDI